jgi:Peptidase propeptide and YPEB domain
MSAASPTTSPAPICGLLSVGDLSYIELVGSRLLIRIVTNFEQS